VMDCYEHGNEPIDPQKERNLSSNMAISFLRVVFHAVTVHPVFVTLVNSFGLCAVFQLVTVLCNALCSFSHHK
jgi:hypothetical protein